jgi:hypothetical protein
MMRIKHMAFLLMAGASLSHAATSDPYLSACLKTADSTHFARPGAHLYIGYPLGKISQAGNLTTKIFNISQNEPLCFWWAHGTFAVHARGDKRNTIHTKHLNSEGTIFAIPPHSSQQVNFTIVQPPAAAYFWVFRPDLAPNVACQAGERSNAHNGVGVCGTFSLTQSEWPAGLDVLHKDVDFLHKEYFAKPEERKQQFYR